jgi:Flp pilus assembly protein TadG
MSVRRNVRSVTGGALVELAIVLPLLIIIFAGGVDFARVFYATISLTNAARAGAQYGSASLAKSLDSAGMQATAVAAVNLTGVTAVASRSCQCWRDDGTSSSANDCTATCSAGTHRVMTVTVTASTSFTTILSILPGIARPLNLSRSATQRVVN